MQNYSYEQYQYDSRERRKKARQHNQGRQVNTNKSNNKPNR